MPSTSLNNRFANLRAESGHGRDEGYTSDGSMGEVRSQRAAMADDTRDHRTPREASPEAPPAREETYAEVVGRNQAWMGPDNNDDHLLDDIIAGDVLVLRMFGVSDRLDDKGVRYDMAFKHIPEWAVAVLGKTLDEVHTVDYLKHGSTVLHEYAFEFHLRPIHALRGENHFEQFRITIFNKLSDLNCRVDFCVLGSTVTLTATVPYASGTACTYYNVITHGLNFQQTYQAAVRLVQRAYRQAMMTEADQGRRVIKADTRLPLSFLRITEHSPNIQMIMPALAYDPLGLLCTDVLVGTLGRAKVTVLPTCRICDTCSEPPHPPGKSCPKPRGSITCAACKIGRFTPELFAKHRSCRTHKFACKGLELMGVPIPDDHKWVAPPPAPRQMGPRTASQAGSPFPPPNKRGRRV